MILGEVSRRDSLHFVRPPSLPLLARLVSFEAPVLKSSIATYATTGSPPWDTGLSEPVDLFRGRAPLLQDVKVSNLPLRWNSPMFSNLKSLALNEPPNDAFHLQSQSILDIIAASPNLVALQLVGIGNADRLMTASMKERSPIVLPHLKSLVVTKVHPLVLTEILTTVRAPNLILINASVQEEHRNAPWPTHTVNAELLTRFWKAAISYLGTSPDITLHFRNTGITLMKGEIGWIQIYVPSSAFTVDHLKSALQAAWGPESEWTTAFSVEVLGPIIMHDAIQSLSIFPKLKGLSIRHEAVGELFIRRPILGK